MGVVDAETVIFKVYPSAHESSTCTTEIITDERYIDKSTLFNRTSMALRARMLLMVTAAISGVSTVSSMQVQRPADRQTHSDYTAQFSRLASI